MKNIGKNRFVSDSHSASEAAALLGVSIPTLKRMVAESRLESFRTPGGHLRITAESIDAVREQGQSRLRPVRDASPVLQNRRERLEELTLEAQEHRARRELEKLRGEDQDEADRREAEAQAREEEAAQRQVEIELERARLEFEKAQERTRQEREQAQEQQRRETERELAAFRSRWIDKANEAASAYQYRWLSATQRKEILDGLEAEIGKRQPADEPRMSAIVARSLEALVEPFRAQRNAQERRQRVTERVLWSLPFSATEAERVRATAVIREALERLDGLADECEMRVAAGEAVQPIRQAIERRMLDARLINWAIGELPWAKNDHDTARVRRECSEILADLPQNVSEVEAQEALEPTVAEARKEIEERQAEAQRAARKVSLVQQGIAEVSSYLLKLKSQDEIADEDYWDSDFKTHLQEAVRRGLEAALSGDETAEEVRRLMREIVDGDLE